jgi:hypothetical protein
MSVRPEPLECTVDALLAVARRPLCPARKADGMITITAIRDAAYTIPVFLSPLRIRAHNNAGGCLMNFKFELTSSTHIPRHALPERTKSRCHHTRAHLQRSSPRLRERIQRR